MGNLFGQAVDSQRDEGATHMAEASREELRMDGGVRERGMEGGKRKWKINALGHSIPFPSVISF